MSAQAGLPQEYAEKLRALDDQARELQKRLRAVAAEAALDGDHLQPLVSTLVRKAGAVGHLREDLAALPERVAEAAGKGSA
ncbi:MAG TPA: hypothetical protein VFN92_13355 [Solirubrobacterales bacterium]|nr:hypothetical protein [Solirubrobacterales bacterium]